MHEESRQARQRWVDVGSKRTQREGTVELTNLGSPPLDLALDTRLTLRPSDGNLKRLSQSAETFRRFFVPLFLLMGTSIVSLTAMGADDAERRQG